jgi:DNA polymerase-3 subunit gamma/tau
LSYTALYRIWRPKQWEDVVNQKPVIRILQNALVENKVSHAYLFSGPRGTGKTTVARLLAKAVNCSRREDAEPCNQCGPCQAIAKGSSVDVIEIDAASNRGIDEIRSLRESVRYLPVMGSYKVYIIDEVHMLTPEAFNALLKTLEEPPEHVMFILATTAAHKIPVTIASRCQRLEFRRLSIEDIEGQLEKILVSQDIQWEKGALRLIARAAGGSMRDGLSILDLCITYGDGKVLEKDAREILGETSGEVMARLFKAISREDLKGVIDVVREISERGKDMGELCQEIGVFARDLLFLASGGEASGLGRTPDELKEMKPLSGAFPKGILIRLLEATSNAISQMRNSDNPRLVVDVALLGLFTESEPVPAYLASDMVQAQSVRPLSAGHQVTERTTRPRPRSEASAGGPIEQAQFGQWGAKGQTGEMPGEPDNETGHGISRDSAEDPERVQVGGPRPDGNLLEIVQQVWDSLLGDLQKKRKIQARAYLLPSRPSKVIDNKTLVLAYPQGYATHMEQILTDNHKRVVQDYLEKLINCRLDLAVEVDQPGQDHDNQGAGGNGDDLHPLVKAAITILDGKVVT